MYLLHLKIETILLSLWQYILNLSTSLRQWSTTICSLRVWFQPSLKLADSLPFSKSPLFYVCTTHHSSEINCKKHCSIKQTNQLWVLWTMKATNLWSKRGRGLGIRLRRCSRLGSLSKCENRWGICGKGLKNMRRKLINRNKL